MIRLPIGLAMRRNVGSGQHADHARQLPGLVGIDADDVGVRVRAAQDRGVPQPRHGLEIVDEARAAGQQGRVLEAQDALADPLVGGCCHDLTRHTRSPR